MNHAKHPTRIDQLATEESFSLHSHVATLALSCVLLLAACSTPVNNSVQLEGAGSSSPLQEKQPSATAKEEPATDLATTRDAEALLRSLENIDTQERLFKQFRIQEVNGKRWHGQRGLPVGTTIAVLKGVIGRKSVRVGVTYDVWDTRSEALRAFRERGHSIKKDTEREIYCVLNGPANWCSRLVYSVVIDVNSLRNDDLDRVLLLKLLSRASDAIR